MVINLYYWRIFQQWSIIVFEQLITSFLPNMHSIQNTYTALINEILDTCTSLKNSGCSVQNIYLGEEEYKTLSLQLNPQFSFSVIYQTPPQHPYEMFFGMRVYQVYNYNHFEITWQSPFAKKTLPQ